MGCLYDAAFYEIKERDSVVYEAKVWWLLYSPLQKLTYVHSLLTTYVHALTAHKTKVHVGMYVCVQDERSTEVLCSTSMSTMLHTRADIPIQYTAEHQISAICGPVLLLGLTVVLTNLCIIQSPSQHTAV